LDQLIDAIAFQEKERSESLINAVNPCPIKLDGIDDERDVSTWRSGPCESVAQLDGPFPASTAHTYASVGDLWIGELSEHEERHRLSVGRLSCDIPARFVTRACPSLASGECTRASR